MGLHRLTRLTLGVPNVEEVATYYEEFGLRALGGDRFATLDGGEQLRLVSSPKRRAVEVGVAVEDADDLDKVSRKLSSLGIEHERFDGSLRTFDAGTGVAVVLEISAKVPSRRNVEADALPIHDGSPSRENGRADCLERPDTDLSPRRLGHVVLGSIDREASERLFIDGIGFKVSDQIKDSASFLRCSPDHHNLLISSASQQYLHHTSWEVSDLDAVGQAARKLLDADETRHVWGPGRHYVGSNFFWYLRDPAGNFTEYYADMDVITDDELWTPGVWEGAAAHYLWGPTPPGEIFDPEDLVAAMVGGHS